MIRKPIIGEFPPVPGNKLVLKSGEVLEYDGERFVPNGEWREGPRFRRLNGVSSNAEVPEVVP